MTRPLRLRPIDVVVLCLIGVVTTALFIGFRRNANNVVSRVACASNLSLIGKALLLYTNDERNGAYPRGPHDPATARNPVIGTPYEDDRSLDVDLDADPFVPGRRSTPKANDVTAAIYLLLRTQDIASSSFVCPATDQTPIDFAGRPPQRWTNWRGVDAVANHLSYSFQNPYQSPQAIARGFQLSSTYLNQAIAADMNPGSEALLTVATRNEKMAVEAQYDAATLRAINSKNHGGTGQNVLFNDGHVEWVTHPFVSPGGDNIYTRAGLNHLGTARDSADWELREAIVGPPFGALDSVLLPTARQLGR